MLRGGHIPVFQSQHQGFDHVVRDVRTGCSFFSRPGLNLAAVAFQLIVQGGGVCNRAVAAAGFGAVQGPVGLVEQFGWIGGLHAHGRSAKADGDRYPQRGAGRHGTSDALRRVDGARQVGFGQDQTELFPAVTANNVAFAQTVAQDAAYLLNHFIADRMAMVVVDRLEVVDIDHDARQGVPVALGPVELDLESLKKGAPVETAGQWILGGQDLQGPVLAGNFVTGTFQGVEHLLELGILGFDLGHVVEGCQGAARFAGTVDDRRPVDHEGAHIALLAFQRQRHRRLAGPLAHGPAPGQIIERLAGTGGEPIQLGCLLAQERPVDMTHVFFKGLVGQYDAFMVIHQDHTFDQTVQGELDPFRHHGRRVQVTQRFLHQEVVAEKGERYENGQQFENRLLPEVGHQTAFVGLEADLEGSPALLAFENRHLDVVRG